MGSGFKTFSPGDVLTASDVNNFLMEQSVMSFADDAARTSAIGTANFEEGMVAYLQDTDKIQVYNGTAWVDAANNTGAGLIHIETADFTDVATLNINNIFSAEYLNYKILWLINPLSSSHFRIRVRGGGSTRTGANSYDSQIFEANGATLTGARTTANIGNLDRTDVSSTTFGYVDMNVYRPFTTSSTRISGNTSKFGTSPRNVFFDVNHAQTDANIQDGLSVSASTGNISGTYQVFGYKD